MNKEKSSGIIDYICGVVALLNIAVMFIPYAKDWSDTKGIVSLGEFQFAMEGIDGGLLGEDLVAVGIVALIVLILAAILLIVWAIRSFMHHPKAGKSGTISSIIKTLVSVIFVVMLSHSREFTAGIAVLIIAIGIAGVILSIIQRKKTKKEKDPV